MYYTLVKDNNDKNNEISKGELYEKNLNSFRIYIILKMKKMLKNI